MTVGAVSSVDDVNTIILAGRADLCLLARPHLVDPYWTLNAAIDQGHEATIPGRCSTCRGGPPGAGSRIRLAPSARPD